MKSYEQFWEELVPAYPITKWEIKIPIATELETFDVDFDNVVKNLDDVMQQLFKKNEEAKRVSTSSFEKWFTDLYKGNFTGIVRFDCMFNTDWKLKLVEVNTKWPDWLLMHDNTYSILSGTFCNKNLDLFLQLFDKEENIFIMYENEGFIDSHFLEYQKIVGRWYKASIWIFENLEFRDDSIFFDGNIVDVIRFSVSPWRLTENQISLLKNKKVRFVNTPDIAGMWDKSLLKWIENPMIMETFLLDEKIKDDLIQNKNNYVIKPTNLDEGNWVFIGIELSQEERERLIKENIGKKYLAQEYITISPKKTSLYLDGWIVEGDFYYDFCPHLFYKNGKLIGTGHVLVRYSKNKIVNVLRGGGIGYWKRG